VRRLNGRWLLAVALAMGAAGLCTDALAGAGPFGVGLPESAGAVRTGPYGRLMGWISAQQSGFYRALTGALKGLKDDGRAAVTLAGLSFLYGVFHAAGPGHGKVVLSSYLLANEATLRRGALLALAASAVQASVAVALVTVLALALGATGMAITQTARLVELGSFLMIALLGTALLWAKLGLATPFASRPPVSLGAAAVPRGHDAACLCCGVSHMPHPRLAQGSRRAALTAVLAIGARPCTGGIVVLVFALSQGLFSAGVASVYVMALGTFVTVAALAALAVYGKRAAIGLLGRGGRWPVRVHRALEISGAALVLVFGITLFLGSL